jgi:hypothetical protein
MAKIERRVRREDGTVEVFLPHRNRRGKYVIAPRNVVYRNVKEVEQEVDRSELDQKARTGEYCIRMSTGHGRPSLIAPDSYVVSD